MKTQIQKYSLDPTVSLIRRHWTDLHRNCETWLTRWPRAQEIAKTARLDVSNKMTRCAGIAYTRSGIVRISLPIFRRRCNQSEIPEILAHELAHVIADKFVGTPQNHSPEWYFWARTLGSTGAIYHNLDIHSDPLLDDLVL